MDNNGRTQVTLTIDVTYVSGSTTTIDYSRFYLQLSVSKFLYDMYVGTLRR
ncbi:MAG: hypothetical protein LBI79_05470 [Nitrososphaerota archaeon]|nr:hypothetical protein [Nitrososphaerota archaeon]